MLSRILLGLPKTGARRRYEVSRQSSLNFERLEARELLAGILFDSSTGNLTIAGDNLNNVGQLNALDSSTVRASIDGIVQDYSASSIAKVIFIGFAGDDQFTNATGIEGLFYGNDGNDLLIGGSGIDKLNGGNGNDVIRGGDGDDRLTGGNGDDMLYGSNGNDFLATGGGTSFAYGEDGNDVLFGGDQVDTLDGGEGNDQIFGGAGDDFLSSGNGGIIGTPGVALADWVMGNAGNDTITGGGGLNVFYGGDGNDTLVGGDGENRFHGQNGNDNLTGGAGQDYLSGNSGDDTINGMGGVDFLLPGTGNDSINGGDGNDFIVFIGLYADFQIYGTGTSFTVVDTRSGNGTDTITSGERFRFNNGDYPAASPIDKVVTIQPIIVSNSDGTNTSEYFGDATQQSQIMAMIDGIFYQAGIDINWLTKRNWNNTFANIGYGGDRPSSDLGAVVSQGDAAGVGHANPLIVDMYFVEIAAGFGETTENTANGLAFVDANGITIHIGDNLASFAGGREVVARVAAHEIAHNLGLDHVASSANLMADGTQLSPVQIANMRDSQFAANF